MPIHEKVKKPYVLRFGLLLCIVMLKAGPQDLVVPEIREFSHRPSDAAMLFLIGRQRCQLPIAHRRDIGGV